MKATPGMLAAVISFILCATGAWSEGMQDTGRVAHPSGLTYPALKWEVPMGEPYRTQMPNGLKAYVARDRTYPLVMISGYISGGSLFDPPGKEGLSHFMTHLLRTGGTRSYHPDTLDALIDRFAIEISVSSGEDEIKFSCQFLSEFADTALKVLEEMLFRPAFDSSKVESERSLFIEKIKTRFVNPAPILDAAYGKALYPGSPNSRLTTIESMRSITREDLVALHAELIRTDRIMLAIAGDFDEKKMRKKIASHFPRSPGKAPAPLKAEVNPKATKNLLIVHKPITQAYVQMGLPLVKRPHPDYYPLSVLNLILGGGGFNNRLTTTIRSDKGLTYSIYSSVGSNYTYPSTFFISFHTKTSSATAAIDLSLKEVRTIIAAGVTDKELSDAKKVLIDGLPSMFRDMQDIVDTYAWSEFKGRDKEHFRNYPKQIEAITKEDVARVAKTYLTPERFTFVIVADTSALFSSDTLKDFSVRNFSNHQIVSPDDVPAL